MEFSNSERKFLETLEECRIATCHDNIPHVKPVSYIIYNNMIIVATDYNTRTLKNVKNNSNVAVTVDIYKSGHHKAVCIQGRTTIIENGEEFKKLYAMFHKRFAWVRNEPWSENEAPFLKIIPTHKISWGL